MISFTQVFLCSPFWRREGQAQGLYDKLLEVASESIQQEHDLQLEINCPFIRGGTELMSSASVVHSPLTATASLTNCPIVQVKKDGLETEQASRQKGLESLAAQKTSLNSPFENGFSREN